MDKSEEYYWIGKRIEMMKERRAFLRTEIMGDPNRFQRPGWKVEVRLRRKQRIDDAALDALLESKGLLDQCSIKVIDYSLVEQAYLDGKLTDTDMREIDAGGVFSQALIVEKEGEESVSRDDESTR
jgi:hypothetical protein